MLSAAAIILFLILLTALYVAAAFAAVGARRSRLRRLAEDGNGLAARILPVLDDPRALDRYIAASQVGITLSSLILGAYGQASIAPRLAPLLEASGMRPESAESASVAVVLLTLPLSLVLKPAVGIEHRAAIDSRVLVFLSRCNESRTVRQLISDVSQNDGVDFAAAAAAGLPLVRRLLRAGFLIVEYRCSVNPGGCQSGS